MSVDLSQFHQVFFEESFEGLDVMETSLMELDPNDIDSEVINCIFRAAHSIKGGAATFGFSEIANFTHVLETLLDDIRAGKRSISQDEVDLFLQSVDCMRDMLGATQAKEELDLANVKSVQEQFEKILESDSNSAAQPDQSEQSDSGPGADNEAASAEPIVSGWQIEFKPEPDMLQTGNEPARMFRDLAALGDVSVKVFDEALPSFESMNPELCYLHWQVELVGSAAREDIDEVFEWVVDGAEIKISPIHLGATDTSAAPSTSGWNIHFRPGADTLRTGNDCVRLLRELAGMGELTVNLNHESLPTFESMNPEQSYFAWDLILKTESPEEDIRNIFEWVVDESDLTISPPKADVAPKVSGAETGATNASKAEESIPAGGASTKPATEAATSTAPKPAARARNEGASKETSSIRVAIDKIDNLINMVGELVITQSMLGQIGTDFTSQQMPRLLEGLGQLEHNTRELQESVMRIRMLPISFAFSRFPRMVRDLGKRLEKKLDLVLMGEQTELDKTVMERIGDPLVHLVRNAVDHGIEIPADRVEAGKPETGKIVLNAYHQGGNVVIEIIDDGKGLPKDKLLEKALKQNLISEVDAANFTDSQVYDLIFHPGFSTADQVSDVSGRGVGMDVVKRNIQELNGTVDIKSELGIGTTITIRLPLTLAILDGQLVTVGSNTYIFPLVSIVESMQVNDEIVSQVAGGCQVFKLRHDYVPIIRLHEIFGVKPDSYNLKESLLVVVESDGEKVGIVVDDLAAQQQVVIKSLEQNYQRIEGVSGATILGDGTVSLILDVPGIVKLAGVNHINNDGFQRHQVNEMARDAQLQ